MPYSRAFFTLPVGLASGSATSSVVTFLEIPPGECSAGVSDSGCLNVLVIQNGPKTAQDGYVSHLMSITNVH